MKTFSVTDLMLIPELSHLRMVEFIDPQHTNLIAPYLKVLGYDLDYPVQFIASKHRNLQGKEVIAYMLVGDVEINDSFLSSEFATTEDRIIAAGYQDLGKAQDMAVALSSSLSYAGEAVDGFPPDQADPEEQSILMQIKVLDDLLLAVRGSPYKQDGSRATLFEHGVQEKKAKHYRKPEKLAK